MQVTPDSGGRQLSPPATPASAARLLVPLILDPKTCLTKFGPKTHVPKSKAWEQIVNNNFHWPPPPLKISVMYQKNI